MMANRRTRGMIAALLTLTCVPLAHAGERSHRDGPRFERHRHDQARDDRRHRHSGPEYTSSSFGDSDFPSYVRGVGTYAGAVSAFRVRGNGIYFQRDAGNRQESTVVLAPKAKIIEVSQTADSEAFLPRYGCVTEAGVCVIRGDR